MVIDIKNIDENFIALHRGHIYNRAIEDIEKSLIELALKKTYGNRIEAAKILGIHRNTLHYKIKKLDIKVEKFTI